MIVNVNSSNSIKQNPDAGRAGDQVLLGWRPLRIQRRKRWVASFHELEHIRISGTGGNASGSTPAFHRSGQGAEYRSPTRIGERKGDQFWGHGTPSGTRAVERGGYEHEELPPDQDHDIVVFESKKKSMLVTGYWMRGLALMVCRTTRKRAFSSSRGMVTCRVGATCTMLVRKATPNSPRGRLNRR